MANQDSSREPSSTHRLPTVSASEALQNLRLKGPRPIPIGLKQLDLLLRPNGIGSQSAEARQGGLTRGHVTEIFGPPGVGKTTFGMQVAANALHLGDKVVWIDCAFPMVARRFDEILSTAKPPKSSQPDLSSQPELPAGEPQNRFKHYVVPTLSHLLAMFAHPPRSFPPQRTSLIVIDSLSTLFDNAYPRKIDDRGSAAKIDDSRWAAGRRFAVMNDLISKLGKMAALHNLAILITSQTVTRMRSGGGAILLPAMVGVDWESGLSTILVLFRDWLSAEQKVNEEDRDKLKRVRFAGIVKSGGVTAADEGRFGLVVVPFTIEPSGLSDLNLSSAEIAVQPLASPIRPLKRTYAEIADSEDEDQDSDDLYGWAEDDEVAAEGLVVNESALAAANNLKGSHQDDDHEETAAEG